MMLQAAGTGCGTTKTRIMYSAYLSYAQVQEYTRYLCERGLLSFDQGTQLYSLTLKGREFLHLYDRMNALVSIDAAESRNEEAVDTSA